MYREDNSKFLLYIEPKAENKLEKESTNKYITFLQYALDTSKEGIANYGKLDKEERFSEGLEYKGFHITDCGKTSSNKDYLLENGMITNSLCVFYLKWYYDSIPESELIKLEKLKIFYSNE